MDTTALIPENELALARVLSEKQTREIIGISESTSERMKEVGDYPPATQLSERRIGYRLIDIIQWLDKRRRPDSSGGEHRVVASENEGARHDR
jgi:predicted DNA-binding transcriptional regulator AlpA